MTDQQNERDEERRDVAVVERSLLLTPIDCRSTRLNVESLMRIL
jgi:hypothetical protein